MEDNNLLPLRMHIAELEEDKRRLLAQLPCGMADSTIKFLECDAGHGWLTATNWLQHGCPQCRIAKLEAENRKLRDYAEMQRAVLPIGIFPAPISRTIGGLECEPSEPATHVDPFPPKAMR